MERERPLVLCVVVLCCSAEFFVRVSVNGGADGAVETPCIMCCCFVLPAEFFVRVSVNGGADGAVETPCIMCCCFVLLCRLLESQLMEAQMERERPLVLCVVVLCCSAESQNNNTY